MIDLLRERIAAALYNNVYLGDADRYEITDAVIAALGLRQENVELLHRWVTEWATHD